LSINLENPGTIRPVNRSNTKDGTIRPLADEDEFLVRSAQQGDLRAFEALVEKYQKKMLNLAYRLLGDYEEACDAVQEAFLSAFRAVGKFRGEARFSSWLYGIVLNQARNRLKQNASRERHQALSLDDPPGPGSERLDPDPPSRESSVLAQLEKKEIEEKVQECIRQLDEGFREVLVLRDILGHSYEEIQQTLKLPDGTVKSRLFRARESVKYCLKKGFGDL
jgi:RNA polymerase sigma-70 factor (ECF subfamily)